MWADHLRSGVRDQPGQHGEALSLLKIQKISQAWWCTPAIPATQEAEARELLVYLGGRGCSELRLYHCTPAWATKMKTVSKKEKEHLQHPRSPLIPTSKGRLVLPLCILYVNESILRVLSQAWLVSLVLTFVRPVYVICI